MTSQHIPFNRPLSSVTLLLRPKPLLTGLAPASLFQMLMTSSAESPKLGHAIQPVVFGEALLVLEGRRLFPCLPPPPPPWSFVCCGNRHRCSSCFTQGHFTLIATLYADGFHLLQQLPPFLSLSLPLNSPFLTLFLCFLCFFSHFLYSSDHCNAFPDDPHISAASSRLFKH